MIVSCITFIMKTSSSLILLFLLGCHSYQVNERPIIGIVAQELDTDLEVLKYGFTSYIAASYVKHIEASGARVVPIMIGQDRSYYETILRKVNGVFFPGGDAYFSTPNGFAEAGQYIYEITKEMNDAGDYFPLFGVSLGFELIVTLAAGPGNNVLSNCFSSMNLPLNFTRGSRNSKMFGNAPEQIINILQYGDNTINNHTFCFVQEALEYFNLADELLPLSYGYDNNGLRFISTIENMRYPIYGTQFHPEKVAYEWIPKNFVHTPEAVLANRYFMDFFVSESRKNFHHFSSVDEENQYLIYNYIPIFIGTFDTYFEQTYAF